MLSCFKKQDRQGKTGSSNLEADIDYCPFGVFNAGLTLRKQMFKRVFSPDVNKGDGEARCLLFQKDRHSSLGYITYFK